MNLEMHYSGKFREIAKIRKECGKHAWKRKKGANQYTTSFAFLPTLYFLPFHVSTNYTYKHEH